MYKNYEFNLISPLTTAMQMQAKQKYFDKFLYFSCIKPITPVLHRVHKSCRLSALTGVFSRSLQ